MSVLFEIEETSNPATELEPSLMAHRLTAGQKTLNLRIVVRIHVSQRELNGD